MSKEVCSFWIGNKPLHYTNHICLASYVSAGHKVTLYTTADLADSLVAPDGVNVRSCDEIVPNMSQRLRGRVPATAADLFRVILMKARDVIWIDTDVYCVKPFPETLPYIFATEAPEKLPDANSGNINNAIMAFPNDSEALDLLDQFGRRVLGIADEVDPRVQDFIDNGRGHAILKFGPRALTHFLGLTGELSHQLDPHTLYPVHFNLIDCIFDPDVNVNARFKDDTLALHIWGSQIRNGWYRRRAWKRSFMWKAAKELNINMNKFVRHK